MSGVSAIHFKCPSCGREHQRGYYNGAIGVFRCLNCGYIGHGFHPDEAIDQEIGNEIRLAQEWNRAHGIEEGAFEP